MVAHARELSPVTNKAFLSLDIPIVPQPREGWWSTRRSHINHMLRDFGFHEIPVPINERRPGPPNPQLGICLEAGSDEDLTRASILLKVISAATPGPICLTMVITGPVDTPLGTISEDGVPLPHLSTFPFDHQPLQWCNQVLRISAFCDLSRRESFRVERAIRLEIAPRRGSFNERQGSHGNRAAGENRFPASDETNEVRHLSSTTPALLRPDPIEFLSIAHYVAIPLGARLSSVLRNRRDSSPLMMVRGADSVVHASWGNIHVAARHERLVLKEMVLQRVSSQSRSVASDETPPHAPSSSESYAAERKG